MNFGFRHYRKQRVRISLRPTLNVATAPRSLERGAVVYLKCGSAMELREYLSIRRAYNLVRQELGADRRLTFVELAILCRLSSLGRSMKTSEIAEYQGSLRPTMTHRTKHLAEMGFMLRSKGSSDRRNVVCEITDEGSAFVDEICLRICEVLRNGTILSRTTPKRICRYVDAMGSVTCMSGELVLLGIMAVPEQRATVSELVGALGLLQPTVSMAVSALEDDELIVRRQAEGSARSGVIELTDAGMEQATRVGDAINALVVRRKP